MNPLQSGTPASELAPQSYKNSSQNPSFQDTFNIQNSSNVTGQTLFRATPSSTTLKVETGQNKSVLGTSSTAVAQTTQNVTNQSNGGSVMFGMLFLLVSLVLAVYFVLKFKKLAQLENE